MRNEKGEITTDIIEIQKIVRINLKNYILTNCNIFKEMDRFLDSYNYQTNPRRHNDKQANKKQWNWDSNTLPNQNNPRFDEFAAELYKTFKYITYIPKAL